MKKILTIAGSDSCGGAGIQADLKIIALMGAYGMSVVTALTAQNTKGVAEVFPVPSDFILRQMNVIKEDIGVDGVKTGMLYNGEIINKIAELLSVWKPENLVVDPVMIAQSGDALLDLEGQNEIKDKLFPLAKVVTPNLPEASILTGFKVETLKDMGRAAEKILSFGPSSVLIKGGHLEGTDDLIDLLYDGKEFFNFKFPKIKTLNTHGTGCTLSTAITVLLVQGYSVYDSIKKGREIIQSAITNSLNIGRGGGPINPYSYFLGTMEKSKVIEQLKEAFKRLKGNKAGILIPEVQSNLGFALPEAETAQDVAAFPGRIIRINKEVEILQDPVWGASKHIARVILSVMKFNPDYRSAMNIKYSEEIIKICYNLNYVILKFDRALEPEDVKEKEGATLKWGIHSILGKGRKVPDIVYDLGETGKEPMVRVIGENPLNVVGKILKIISKMDV
ncbi:MAG: bifunctional hydroxymethylpyrimidine kinase/phosphomethylpyrimidine kinase [Thermodesulfobacteriota bacterium]|nr:bifunctional hydroxymethylpyrimidine kinase/phosphomethylpyrimidine kinase [Thermodesulfobacteriota bacterium]